ncbi:MAG: chlororespiratory reduction protein 7 [Leptolyngbya sp. SIO4C1]|nr:chlororespiratory reduction protein 7 [Leptolyngbya sp. SIO4C1]
MSDATLYSEEMFVLLVPGAAEVFLTPAELQARLQQMLSKRQDRLPRDLQKLDSVKAQAKYLRDTGCEFEVEPGVAWQWYGVRLEK